MTKCRMLLFTVLLSAVAACGSGATPSRDAERGASAVSSVYTIMAERADLGSEAQGPRSIGEALPGSKLAQRLNRSFSDVVVTGSVLQVREGQAYKVVNATDSPVPWERGDADIASAYVTLRVRHKICSSQHIGKTLQFRFFMPSQSDLGTVQNGLKQMRTIAVFLKAAPDLSDRVFYPADAAGLLSPVGPDGRIAWPVAQKHYGAHWATGGKTVASLTRACPM